MGYVALMMKGVEEGTIDESSRPDHTGRPDNKLTKKPTKEYAEALGSKCKKDLEDHGVRLAVEDMAREDDIA